MANVIYIDQISLSKTRDKFILNTTTKLLEINKLNKKTKLTWQHNILKCHETAV